MNNPPAFPNNVKPINERAGMTLRDYFAAKAMQGDVSAGAHDGEFPAIAKRAYAMADAMMKAREA